MTPRRYNTRVELTVGQQEALMHAARESIRRTLRGEPVPALSAPADPALQQPAGCFVSLQSKTGHRLRGCVGRLEATGPLWETVCITARNVLQDPRFARDPVLLEELPKLSLELSILSPLRPAAHPLDF